MEGERVLAHGAFAEWLLADERSELAGYLGVSAQSELGLPPFLEHLESIEMELFDVSARPVEVFELAERFSSPEREGFIEQLAGSEWITVVTSLSGLRSKPGEANVLDGVRRRDEAIAARLGLDPSLGVLWERLSQAGEVGAESRRVGVGAVVVGPEILSQPVDCDDLPISDHEQREEALLPRTADVDRSVDGIDTDAAEDPER